VQKTVLETKDLTKRFGSVTSLDRVTMEVGAGEWVSIMGPSGSGKTTMLNILACLDTPTSGQYILDGVDTSTLAERERVVVRREKIGLIFQQFHLVPYLTALENVMLAQYYHGMTDKWDATEALERVRLGHRTGHLPSQLSGGEQQRVCIARALINEPAIILADEPTGNLDEANEGVILDIFNELHKEGRTIILVTHNPELAGFSDRVVRLHHGRVEEDVPGDEASANCVRPPQPRNHPSPSPLPLRGEGRKGRGGLRLAPSPQAGEGGGEGV
jgi:putative ABC transport system ATP-binding protein